MNLEWSHVEFLLQLLYKWLEVLMNLTSEIFGSNFCKLWGFFVIESSCGLDWCWSFCFSLLLNLLCWLVLYRFFAAEWISIISPKKIKIKYKNLCCFHSWFAFGEFFFLWSFASKQAMNLKCILIPYIQMYKVHSKH